MHWKIGEVGITSVIEQGLHDIETLIPGATPELIEGQPWLRPHFVGDDGKMLGVVQAFVVETPSMLIVVDCCVGDGKERPALVGHGWHRSQHRFLEKLAAAGYARENIDVVLCTHLHMDHVGWNTMQVGDVWVPTFPNARYLFARREYEHMMAELTKPPVLSTLGIVVDELLSVMGDPQKLPSFLETKQVTWEDFVHAVLDGTNRQAYADSIAPVVKAGQMTLVDGEHRICPEVRLSPTPGHTPGHVSVSIESQGQTAFITGDAVHHPVQIAVPGLSTVADADPQAAVKARSRILAALEGGPTLLIGSHFAEPTAGLVRRGADGYYLDCTSHAAEAKK